VFVGVRAALNTADYCYY